MHRLRRQRIVWIACLVSGLLGGCTASGFSQQASSDFLPIGMYCVEDPSEFPQIAAGGFNLVQAYRFEGVGTATDEEALAYLDAAEASGIRVLMGIQQEAVLTKDLAIVEQRIHALKDHPALFGWQLFDEPENAAALSTIYGTNTSVSPEAFREIYRTIKRIDPLHPVTIAAAGALDEQYAYFNGTDMFMLQYGASPPGVYDYPYDTLENLMPLLKADAALLSAKGKSFLLNTAAYNIANDPMVWPKEKPKSMSRYPTREEIRLVAYDALMHGAQGIIINCYRFPDVNGEGGDDISPRANPTQWQAVSSVASELKAMSLILLEPTVDSEEAGVTIMGEGPVELMVKRHQGSTYLFTANPSSGPIEQQLWLDPVRFPQPTIRLLPVGKPMASQENTLTDHWAPYEVRIYEILPESVTER